MVPMVEKTCVLNLKRECFGRRKNSSKIVQYVQMPKRGEVKRKMIRKKRGKKYLPSQKTCENIIENLYKNGKIDPETYYFQKTWVNKIYPRDNDCQRRNKK